MGEEEFAQTGEAAPAVQETVAQDSGEWLDAFDVKELQRGQVVEGVIVDIRENEVLVDVGSKSEGVIYGRELERLGPEGLARLQVGKKILVYVMMPEDKNGNIALSISRAQAERDWRKAEELEKSGAIFEGEVTGYNKGGLIVRMGKLRGFVPASQIVSQGANGDSANLVGKKLWLKVIEIDRSRNRLILSERAARREQRKQQKEDLLSELKEGDIRTGEVISLCDFGAFVDLGGADGLIHLSELSWRRVNHPSEVLSVGDKVKVYVLNIDRDRKRIGLSLKRAQEDPWSVIARQYQQGQLVEGTITKLVKFGAFARLADSDVEGLIHISELSDEHVTHPKEVLKEGQVVTLRVIHLDSERHRIGLSLKQVASPKYIEQDWQGDLEEFEEDLSEEDVCILEEDEEDELG